MEYYEFKNTRESKKFSEWQTVKNFAEISRGKFKKVLFPDIDGSIFLALLLKNENIKVNKNNENANIQISSGTKY